MIRELAAEGKWTAKLTPGRHPMGGNKALAFQVRANKYYCGLIWNDGETWFATPPGSKYIRSPSFNSKQEAAKELVDRVREVVSKAIKESVEQSQTKAVKGQNNVEKAAIFPPGRYTWFKWNKTGAMTIRSAKGREYRLLKGAKFGIRPATSKKGMYRVITEDLGQGIVFSMDQDQVDKLTKNSVMTKG